MRFRITGSNRATGHELSTTIEAATESQAREIAAHSMTITEIHEEEDPLTVDYASPPREDVPARLPPKPVQPAAAPDYGAIKRGALVLTILAVLCYVGGAISLLFGFAILLLSSNHSQFDTATAITLILGTISSFITGAVLEMLAAIGIAVRDIARNSFPRR